jgi:hypothetical protein
MSDWKLVSLKVPVGVLAVIDRQAARDGLTRTALLLKPWLDEDGQPLEAPRREPPSPEVAAAAKRVSYPPKPLSAEHRIETAKAALKAKGETAATGSELLSSVHLGPVAPKPGTMLKPDKGGKK